MQKPIIPMQTSNNSKTYKIYCKPYVEKTAKYFDNGT